MALIPCPECTHPVSDLASACPSCGRPLGTPAQSLTTSVLVKSVLIWACLIGAVLLVLRLI